MCTIFEIIGGLNTSRFRRHRGNSLIVHIDKLYVTIYSTHLDMTYHNHINFLPARSTMGTISKYPTTLIGFMCIKKNNGSFLQDSAGPFQKKKNSIN